MAEVIQHFAIVPGQPDLPFLTSAPVAQLIDSFLELVRSDIVEQLSKSSLDPVGLMPLQAVVVIRSYVLWSAAVERFRMAVIARQLVTESGNELFMGQAATTGHLTSILGVCAQGVGA